MNLDTIKGQWKQLAGEAQRQWGKLTDDDLDVINGDQKKLAGKLQERYGFNKEEAEEKANKWIESL